MLLLSVESVAVREQSLPAADQTNQARKVAQEILKEVVTQNGLGCGSQPGFRCFWWLISAGTLEPVLPESPNEGLAPLFLKLAQGQPVMR